MRNKALTTLWEFAENEALQSGSTLSHVLDPIGLILFKPLKREEYESTPINSLAFATTGGDGVHYSLLTSGPQADDQWPVVMTVPMNFGHENMIVGGDVWDFLSLGCRTGYFFLEQLTYDFPATVYWLEHPEEWFEGLRADSHLSAGVERQLDLLRRIQLQLDLKPWERIPERLRALHDQYHSTLELPFAGPGAA